MSSAQHTQSTLSACVIGGGPAGLMAAEVLSQAGVQVNVYDAMPSVGRKFLMAGKGGLNLTHSEAEEKFLARYGKHRADLQNMLQAFGAQALCDWAHALGIATFVGSSGRVFPREMKAAPLLRAWISRLRARGVHFHMRHRWLGWDASEQLLFQTPQGQQRIQAEAVVLALGGGSWPRLGSDGAWQTLLAQRGIAVAPLRPANCGFDIAWSEHFLARYAGHPLKNVALSFTDLHGRTHQKLGECMITQHGIEGGLIYAFSSALRDTLDAQGSVQIQLDLLPTKSLPQIIEALSQPRGARSQASHLQSRLGMKGVKAGLLRERLTREEYAQVATLAAAIKALPLQLLAPRPLEEAISSAGGVCFQALDANLMLRDLPGVFCAGEMLDWEAPTGGYLLTACFATGRAAGMGAAQWLQGNAKQTHQTS